MSPEFVSLDWADLDGDGDTDLVCGSYAYYEVLNAILYYDSVSGTLVGAGTPFAAFYSERIGLARLDNDQFWDALAMGVDVAGGERGTVVFRGVEGGFEPIQELGDGAWWGDIGELVPPVGVDFVSVCPAGDSLPIAVWPNLVFNPTGVPDPRLARERVLRALPPISSRTIRILVDRSAQSVEAIDVIDVRGRIVRSLEMRNGEGQWDLSDLQGKRVESGVYLLRMNGRERNIDTSKVIVVR